MGANLKEKVAIVTGASRGLGREYAKALAAAGAQVIAADIKDCAETVEEITSAEHSAISIELDVRDQESCRNMANTAVSHFGKIDILVNNAAANPYYGPILNSEDSHWDKIYDVNVKGYFNFVKACSEVMINQKSGKIINVASIAAKTPLEGLGVYNISKASVVMLTKVLAKELGSKNIQVNTLAPGLIKTDFSKALWENEETYNQIVKTIPQGKMGVPEDVAGMALYLASSASDFITGSLFTVDGGLTT